MVLHLIVSLYTGSHALSCHWVILFSISTLGELLGYYSLANWASPSFSSDKKRIEGSGMDLASTGNYIVQYTMDYFYITWFVHIASLFWWKAWWTFMIIPIYGLVKIGSFIFSMLGGASASMPASAPAQGGKGQRK